MLVFMTALTLILDLLSMLNLEYASAAEPELWVAEASIRPKLKIAASFVH